MGLFFRIFLFSLKYSFHIKLKIQCLDVELNLKNVRFQNKDADLGEI